MDLTGMIADIADTPISRAACCYVTMGCGAACAGRRKVRGLRVAVDHKRLSRILAEQKTRAGIIDIRVAIARSGLAVGDDVMFLIVRGTSAKT